MASRRTVTMFHLKVFEMKRHFLPFKVCILK